MGGKSKAPPAPDYSSIANASIEAAQLARQTAQEQLAYAREQSAKLDPYVTNYLDAMTRESSQQVENARTDRERYETIYQPLENRFVDQASGWNSATRSEQRAGAAMGDVRQAFEARRQSALSQLESYGIDPSQTRFQALDLGTRVQEAAATAAAGTQSRLQSEATGLALQGEAINIGKGYPGQVAQSYAGAVQAGNSAIGSAIGANNSATYAQGSPTQWMGTGTGYLNAGTSAMNAGYQNNLQRTQFNNQLQAGTWNAIGSLVGGGLSAMRGF